MFNTEMIERLAAAQRSDLAREVAMTRLPKKIKLNHSGFVSCNLKCITDFVDSVVLNLKEWGHSNSKGSPTTIDT